LTAYNILLLLNALIGALIKSIFSVVGMVVVVGEDICKFPHVGVVFGPFDISTCLVFPCSIIPCVIIVDPVVPTDVINDLEGTIVFVYICPLSTTNVIYGLFDAYVNAIDAIDVIDNDKLFITW
jgi:hypothetical protein